MKVVFESPVNAWDAQIPHLLVELVNHAVFSTGKKEFQAAIAKMSATTDFDKFFAYGYGRHHFWLNQCLATDSSKHVNERLLIVDFYSYNPKNADTDSKTE